MALSIKRGDAKLSDFPEDIRKELKNIVANMSEKDIEKFAATSHEGLPDKVEEEGEATLDNVPGQESGEYYLPDGSNKLRELTEEELRMLFLSKKASGLKVASFEEFKKKLNDS